MKSIAEKITDKAKGEKSLKKLIAKREAVSNMWSIDRHVYDDRYVFEDGSVIDMLYINQRLIDVFVCEMVCESACTDMRKVPHLCA